MAESRVEKYKEYRKSILTDGNPVVKTAIETSLETGSVESNTSPTYVESMLLKRIHNTKKIQMGLYAFAFLTIVLLMVIFGLILF